jgi:hypothetical protein
MGDILCKNYPNSAGLLEASPVHSRTTMIYKCSLLGKSRDWKALLEYIATHSIERAASSLTNASINIYTTTRSIPLFTTSHCDPT